MFPNAASARRHMLATSATPHSADSQGMESTEPPPPGWTQSPGSQAGVTVQGRRRARKVLKAEVALESTAVTPGDSGWYLFLFLFVL